MNRETTNRKMQRARLHRRVRTKISGTATRPRFNVCFTGQHIYAQIIDDESARTLASVSTTEKGLRGQAGSGTIRPNVKGAAQVGQLIAERARSKGIASVVFDRGGFHYHGKVAALANAAREHGLQF